MIIKYKRLNINLWIHIPISEISQFLYIYLVIFMSKYQSFESKFVNIYLTV